MEPTTIPPSTTQGTALRTHLLAQKLTQAAQDADDLGWPTLAGRLRRFTQVLRNTVRQAADPEYHEDPEAPELPVQPGPDDDENAGDGNALKGRGAKPTSRRTGRPKAKK